MVLAALTTQFADANAARSVIEGYVTPALKTLMGIGGILSALTLGYAGFLYSTSSGSAQRLDLAKRIAKGAIIGVGVVAASGLLSTLLSHAFGTPSVNGQTSMPTLVPIKPVFIPNGFVAVAIEGIAGLISVLIQTIGAPLTQALTYFTTSTELMSHNTAVVNLWLVTTAIADSLFVLVTALIGFKIMSGSALGLEEVEFKKLLPQLGIIFLVMNVSLYLIDSLITVSNVMIEAVHTVAGPTSLFDTINGAIGISTGQNIVVLILLLVFVVAAIILVVYYIIRLLILYIGAVLAPLIALVWLIPGFRDFAETAVKTYITTIFVLFVHVVVLQLAASLLSTVTLSQDPTLIIGATLTGLAAIVALLKTQSVMSHYSFVSGGTRNARRLGSEFASGIGYLASRGRIGKLGPIRTSGSGSYGARSVANSGVTVTKTSAAHPTPRAEPKASPYETYHPKNNEQADTLFKRPEKQAKPTKEEKS